jgi:hypothetical protein
VLAGNATAFDGTLSRGTPLPGTGEAPMVSLVSAGSVVAGSAGAATGAAGAGARTRAGAARLAGGRFFCATRAGRCFGTGTLIVGNDVVPAAGDGALLCAHALYGSSNAKTPTHTHRMNFPGPEFMTKSASSFSKPRSIYWIVTGRLLNTVPFQQRSRLIARAGRILQTNRKKSSSFRGKISSMSLAHELMPLGRRRSGLARQWEIFPI